MHKFEIQNKISVSRRVRRMKLPICGVKSPSKYLLIAIAPHEILPDLCLRNNENQISAIALFVLLMFVCEKPFRSAEGFFQFQLAVRYSLGEHPTTFLNRRVKCCG